MGKFLKILYRISSVAIVAVMLMSLFVCSTSVNAASDDDTQKKEKSYEIAIAYDNSGSMYNNEAWCRAKYAMEIFASMLDYEKGDRLTIFPMWEVTVDGSRPTGGPVESQTPITVSSKKDIDYISNMYTVCPSGTPFTPVDKAYEFLKNSDKDEKWLIVLTDGVFNGGPTAETLKNMLIGKATNGIKVQYLGFAGAAVLQADKSKDFYTPNNPNAGLEEKLIDICNTIFERSKLPSDKLKAKKLTLDISMKKLIVFVQGEGAEIKSLKDSSGKEIGESFNSGQRKFSEVAGGAGYEKAPCDKTLYGHVVVFESCAKGEYTLDYTGSESAIQIFYEPDVDIKIALKNSDNEIVDPSGGELVAGEYTLENTLVDGVTGEDVTNHQLLGDVSFTTKVKTSKDEDFKDYPDNKIVLTPDSATEVIVEGTYLVDYTISTKDDPDAFPVPIRIKEKKLQVDAKVLQSQSWYKISDHENWKPIRVGLSIDGEPLTDEQLKAVKLELELKGIPCRYEMIPGESACNVYIAQDESGKYIKPETGNYKLIVNASYTDEFGTTLEGTADAKFEVRTYDKFWKWLFWIGIFAIILAIWLLIMSQKVLPKKIVKDTANFSTMTAGDLGENFVDVEYRRKSRSLTVTTIGSVAPDERCDVTFSLQPIDSRFKKSRERRFKITNIQSSSSMVSINNLEYLQHENGNWVKGTFSDAQNPPPVAHETRNPTIIVERGADATLTCKLKNQ